MSEISEYYERKYQEHIKYLSQLIDWSQQHVPWKSNGGVAGYISESKTITMWHSHYESSDLSKIIKYYLDLAPGFHYWGSLDVPCRSGIFIAKVENREKD